MTEWFKGELGPLEKTTEVSTYRVALTCPKCGEGEMRFTGMTWPTGDPGLYRMCAESEIELYSPTPAAPVPPRTRQRYDVPAWWEATI